MLPREIDLNEWLASNSEYGDRAALRLLPAPTRPFNPSAASHCFQSLEKHLMTVYTCCVMCVIIPGVVIKLSCLQPNCAQQQGSLTAPSSCLAGALRASYFDALLRPIRFALTVGYAGWFSKFCLKLLVSQKHC